RRQAIPDAKTANFDRVGCRLIDCNVVDLQDAGIRIADSHVKAHAGDAAKGGAERDPRIAGPLHFDGVNLGFPRSLDLVRAFDGLRPTVKRTVASERHSK